MIHPIDNNAENMPLLPAEAKAELRILYDKLDAEVAGLGPVCQLSGRCCRFEEYGHTLFVSSSEVQFLLEVAPEPSRANRSRQNLPVAKRQRALHSPRRPANRLPGVLLRPNVRAVRSRFVGTLYRTTERAQQPPRLGVELCPAASSSESGWFLLDTTLSQQYT